MIRYRLISILIGAGLDCLIGDPQWMPHPVRLMGALISALESLLRREEDSAAELRFKGLVVTVFVLSTTIRITWGLLIRLYGLHPAAGVAAESILCCYALAARNLRDSSMEVFEALTAADGSLSKARRAVSMIVGRDTENLDREGVGVIAPLFYLALGGAVGGMAYKAINTMDSMLGYKNERYQYFGTVAARLDDAAGFIPARLSGLLLVAAAGLTGMDAANAWRIFCRDRYAHKSPNSAQSESAVAGALGVQLAGDAVYGGQVVHKPFIGDPLREIEAEDIRRANKLMYAASGLGLGLAAVLLAGIYLLF